MKIIGTGIDIVEISRIAKTYERYDDNFSLKILHEDEMIDLKNTVNKIAFLAKRFAVKEAFVKAYIDAINKTVTRKKSSIINKIGYEFLKESSIDEAIIVFQENTILFPEDANSWDSLGEAYFIKHDKENALKAYKKALELDPNSASAKKMIEKLKNLK